MTRDRTSNLSAVRILVLSTATAASIWLWRFVPHFLAQRAVSDPWLAANMPVRGEYFRFALIQLVTLLWCLVLAPIVAPFLRRISLRWQRSWSVIALTCCAACLAFAVVWAGRRQFAGYDFNIVIEIGWREFLGQRQYIDFVASAPPGFGLALKYAFLLIGPSWDSVLYLTAAFTVVTFLWLFGLLRIVGLPSLASLFLAVCVETETMVVLGFWWYNNSAIVVASIFFLSAIVLAQKKFGWGAQVSFVVSLGLLELMKPNIAGLTVVGCVAILLTVSSRKLTVIGLTAAGSLLAIAMLLVNHVSIPAMLAAYHGASAERGVASSFGFHNLALYYKVFGVVCTLALCLPLLDFFRGTPTEQGKASRSRLFAAFFVLALVIAVFGLRTNGELPQVEWPLLILAGGVIVWTSNRVSLRLSGAFAALLIALLAGDAMQTVTRIRVYETGPHMFFEWTDHDRIIESGFLKNMRVSGTMINVESDVKKVASHDAGPIFFGPRVDFNYAVLGIPSPLHFAAWFHPGTAFARSDLPQLLKVWRGHHFRTLVFLKGDYTYYPDEFMNLIHSDYVEDDSYPTLTVYHLKDH